jgi:iron complex outermembrane receptor protein
LNGVSSTFSGTRTDYRVALSYQWTSDVMTYAQFSTGYKGGGVNPRPFYNVQAVSFEPETLNAIEVGIKSQFFADHLRLNAAAFSNKYKNIQLTLNDCTAQFGPIFGVPCLLNANAGDADVKGAELEFDWYAVKSLQLDGSVSYLDFAYQSVNPVTGVSLTNVTPYTPKTKWSAGAQYDFHLPGGGTITPRVDASHQSKIFTAADNTPLGAIDGYTLVNARVTWRSANDDWQMALEGQNLTDKLYYGSKNDGVVSLSGVAFGTPSLPRTVMFTIKRKLQ